MKRLLPVGLVSLAIAACVTINVYFPAAAAEQAADQVIREVTSGAAPTSQFAPPQADPLASQRRLASHSKPAVVHESWLLVAAGRALTVLVPSASAQANANLDITSAAIRAITGSMKARFPQLKPYFESGAVGLTNKGLIELRDQALVPLAERANVRRLIAEDNKDRDTLYLEIAKANDHPEWADDIRQTFARRWYQSPDGAQPGWYYQKDDGSWAQK
jgi:uncharacterized protein YdbL (DUF1318 family)